jgi:excisionase family DNA binding protein
MNTTTLDGGATGTAVDGDEGSVPRASKSGLKILSHDIPSWAAADASPGHRSSINAREAPAQFGPGIAKTRLIDAAVVKERLSLSKQHVAAGRASRLEQLLTVGETAAILNVSMRTVRRLIASGSISAISIGRSVRLRSGDIKRLIANGGVCND